MDLSFQVGGAFGGETFSFFEWSPLKYQLGYVGKLSDLLQKISKWLKLSCLKFDSFAPELRRN